MHEDILTMIQKIHDEPDYFHKARLLDFVIKKKDVPLKDVSEKLGMKPAYVCHIMRLNKLPDITVDGYYSKLISITHLFVIARLKDQDQMLSVYERVMGEGLNVMQTEALVREALYSIKTDGEHIPQVELGALRHHVMERFPDIDVKLVQTRIKGKIILEMKGNLTETSHMMRDVMKILAGSPPVEDESKS